MKTAILLSLCVVATLCAPSKSESERLAIAAQRALPAVIHEEVHDKLGQYSLRYVTAEGTIVFETGELIPTPDNSGLVLAVKGEVTYIGDDGKKYVTRYSAGLDGYKVEGDHIPKAPTVPVAPIVAAVPRVPAVPEASKEQAIPKVPKAPTLPSIAEQNTS